MMNVQSNKRIAVTLWHNHQPYPVDIPANTPTAVPDYLVQHLIPLGAVVVEETATGNAPTAVTATTEADASATVTPTVGSTQGPTASATVDTGAVTDLATE